MKFGHALGEAAARMPPLALVVAGARTVLRGRRTAGRIARATISLPGGGAAVPDEFARWIAATEPDAQGLLRERAAAARLASTPLVSVILPVYKVPLAMLSAALESLQAQTYPHWEACVACADVGNARAEGFLREISRQDRRIRVVFLPHNGGIAANSNAALALAQGEFVALLDHDDTLAPSALMRMVEAIAAHPEADFLYSDKDSIDAAGGLRQNPLFKPGWSPEMLFSVNYLTHLNLLRRSLVAEVGGFRSETDGAQDWDLFLRVCHRAREVVRVPGALYHWRIHTASTSTGIAAKPYALAGQLRAVADHVARLGLPARVEPNDDSGFHVRWLPSMARRAHVVVDATDAPPWNTPRLVRSIAETLAAAGTGCSLTVVTGAAHVDPEALIAACAAGGLPRQQVRVLPGATNLTQAVHEAVAGPGPTDQTLVFVSGRVASLSPGWLEEVVGWTAGHSEIGFCSGLILDAEGRVVEAGLVVDRFGNGSPLFRGSPLRHWGMLGGPLWYRNSSAASPWLAAINAADYSSAGGLDGRLPFQDAFVGLCQKIGRCGKRGVVVPHARATLVSGILPDVPDCHESVGDDPYFHPAFSSVAPLTLRTPPAAPLAHPRPARRTKILRSLFKRLRRPAINRFTIDALALAEDNTCTLEDLARPQQHPERVGHGPGAGWCNWYLPAFKNAFYGGVMTILRCADFMRRSRGVRQRFVICGGADGAAIRQRIATAFPGLADCPVVVLAGADAIARIPPADFSIATLWTTAYMLLKVRNTGLKCYFLQDFEPLFYPAGSTSAQTELTYSFGFHGIANTRTLRDIYAADYGGTATHFTPQIDPVVFHGTPLRASGGPRRLFFYGRPDHPRNGFELAAVALRRLKESLGDRVEILCAGAAWDPRPYGLAGVVTNLGLLGYRETGDLYRSCDIGFVMMMTRHPSYLPFEFMACGGLLVSNVNRANAWLLEDGVNCLLTPASAPAIASRLSEAVLHFDDLFEVRRRGHELIHRDHSDWDRAFAGVLDFLDSLTAGDRKRAA